MSDGFASFRELPGIGPVIEARLHVAGVHTWQALSDVLLVLHGLRGRTGDSLRDLAELAATRAADSVEGTEDLSHAAADGLRPPDQERSESFLVRVALSAANAPSRTSVTRVRTHTTRSHRGWSPELVARFVEEVVELPSATLPVASAREQAAVLLVGTVIGGGDRSFAATVPTQGLPEREGFSYEAVLVSRPLGDPEPDPRKGTMLDCRTGRGRSPEPLELEFPAVAVPAGIQRLRVVLTVRFDRPVQGPLRLALESAPFGAERDDDGRSDLWPGA